jgi:hypothetical protein
MRNRRETKEERRDRYERDKLRFHNFRVDVLQDEAAEIMEAAKSAGLSLNAVFNHAIRRWLSSRARVKGPSQPIHIANRGPDKLWDWRSRQWVGQ